MGLPQINISFKSKAVTAIQRSENGIVALVVVDTTNETTSYSYSYAADIKSSDWTAENLDLIKLAFLGSPRLVLVERVSAITDIATALGRLKNKNWNWLAVAAKTFPDEQIKAVYDWITEQRAASKTFKAVLPGTGETSMNNEGVVCFATDKIVGTFRTYSTAEYCARIAGVLAGLSMTVSATYYVLSDVTSISESSTPDDDINGGKMILINDGEKVKIASGNNSLHILEEGQTDELKSIKIVEGMDLIRDDIRTTFEENYIGINNSYDNKTIFIGAVNEYFDGLVRQGVLYDEYNNVCEIDIDAQREYLSSKYSIADMSDDEIKVAKTGKYVFAKADIQFCDSIENLDFSITMS